MALRLSGAARTIGAQRNGRRGLGCSDAFGVAGLALRRDLRDEPDCIEEKLA